MLRFSEDSCESSVRPKLRKLGLSFIFSGYQRRASRLTSRHLLLGIKKDSMVLKIAYVRTGALFRTAPEKLVPIATPI